MKPISVVLAGLTLSLAVTLPACADDLYRQAPDNNNDTNSGWLSQTANGASGVHTAYDDFTLASAGTATGVEWTGWINPAGQSVDSFTISFYNNNGGVPGSLIQSTTVSDFTQALIGYRQSVVGMYDFTAAIDPFAATMDTTYWISIVAAPELRASNFNWESSNQGDSTFYEDAGTDGAGSIGTDLAFALTSPVPEPSGLVLAGTGSLALAGLVRRRISRS